MPRLALILSLTCLSAFAYSSMAPLKDGRIGVPHEPAINTVIKFRAVDPSGR